MTNEEEVILALKELKDWEGLPYCIEEPMQNEGIAVITNEALDVAIKALEQQPCDAISRADAEALFRNARSKLNPSDYKTADEFNTRDLMLLNAEQFIHLLPSVTPQQTRWIPVSERLPKAYEFVNCTCHSLIDDREDWVIETVYVPQPSDSPYSDWGNIPMLNSGDCKVVAWMHRDIPQPYSAESEERYEVYNR